MKYWKKYSEDKNRTYPVTVAGSRMWAHRDAAVRLAYGTKPINVAMYKSDCGVFRGFALHLFEGSFYTVSNDGGSAEKLIVHGASWFGRMVSQYDADSRWTRVEGVNHG